MGYEIYMLVGDVSDFSMYGDDSPRFFHTRVTYDMRKPGTDFLEDFNNHFGTYPTVREKPEDVIGIFGITDGNNVQTTDSYGDYSIPFKVPDVIEFLERFVDERIPAPGWRVGSCAIHILKGIQQHLMYPNTRVIFIGY